MERKLYYIILLFLSSCLFANGDVHWQEGVVYKTEMQSSFSKGTTPLWLNSNKYGLSSLKSSNGYMRGSLQRSVLQDSARIWGLGYGADIVAPYNYTSSVVFQQFYAEARWKKGLLTLGSKEYGMEMKNNELSSGSQTLGINSRPVPQIRLSLPDYWVVPFTNKWLSFKGHISYGYFTDNQWQADFTNRVGKYSRNTLYHSKAGYLKLGKEGYPFSLEVGLEMGAQFGGTSYIDDVNGQIKVENQSGFEGYWHAFIPGGSELNETTYKNVEGNHIGSWLLKLNYVKENIGLSVYADHVFEDHSSMFFLDYDGYGSGSQWDEKLHNRFILYDLEDIMLGAELTLKRTSWLKSVVLEYLYTKYQSGPIYHDHSPQMSTHIAGRDEYYNHDIYPGWQHWGMVMGNPLYRSPLYNDDGKIVVKNNRFVAYHLGLCGDVFRNLHYRILATFQKSFGSYRYPYLIDKDNFYGLVEASYSFSGKLKGWNAKLGLGLDKGYTMGDNKGFQITISKTGFLNSQKNEQH